MQFEHFVARLAMRYYAQPPHCELLPAAPLRLAALCEELARRHHARTGQRAPVPAWDGVHLAVPRIAQHSIA